MSTRVLEQLAKHSRHRVESRLDDLLQGGPPRLCEAMRYAVLGGGKRLRPILVLWTHDMLREVETEPVLDVAAAFELVHCYSLVHDDLPCMDDDDLRRGQPACHVQFDEATAVLAGDALLALAFEVVLAAAWTEATCAVACARVLADAASHRQLVGGQMLDLLGEKQPPTPDLLDAIHAAKTAALIRAAMVCGGITAGASDDERATLGDIGQHLGLAFQIVDDILDVTGSALQLGKSAGKDAPAGKITDPALYGVRASRARAEQHIETARDALARWPRSGALRDLIAEIGARVR